MRLSALGISVLIVASGLCAQAEPAKTAPAPTPTKTDAVATVDAAVDAWVKLLSERLADANKVIRDSSQQGLVAIGKPALTHLKTMSASTDTAVAAEAKRVIERIERISARGEGGRPGSQMRPDGERAERPGQVTPESLAKELNLNPDQEEKYTQAMEERSKKMRELFAQTQDGSLTREEMTAQMRDAGEKILKDMKGVLSDEQYSKFEESFRKMRVGGRRRGDG